jgi:hypothetical protein
VRKAERRTSQIAEILAGGSGSAVLDFAVFKARMDQVHGSTDARKVKQGAAIGELLPPDAISIDEAQVVKDAEQPEAVVTVSVRGDSAAEVGVAAGEGEDVRKRRSLKEVKIQMIDLDGGPGISGIEGWECCGARRTVSNIRRRDNGAYTISKRR